MAYISSVGLGIPRHELHQDKVKELIKYIFPFNEKQLERLMPVYDNAMIDSRQLVVGEDWFRYSHSFKERNDLYQNFSIEYALKAMDHCLENDLFLSHSVPYEDIDMIAFVSSTGIATPSIDAHLINERPFRPDVVRMPLWGLGCAGGAIGLSRAHDWITAHPDRTALLVCCELCSLTFQHDDSSKSNIIGTALFGDGIGSVLLVGEDSPYRNNSKKVIPKIIKSSSHIERDTLDVMGWDVTDNGLGVIFSKSIPSLVDSLWKNHLTQFLSDNQLTKEAIHSYIAHPGGRKVLEAMEDVLQHPNKLGFSYQVLKEHGNMSSATVIYVLNEWMKGNISQNELSILSALGPGFSSELLLLEWGN